MSVPKLVAEYRKELRARDMPRGYSGLAHLAFTSSVPLAGIAYSLAHVHAPTWKELLVLPVTFLYANFVEWVAHKNPMHRRFKGLGLVFKRHTVEHHHFFTHESMAIESRRDFKIVLFPAFLIVFFFGTFAVPLGVLAAKLLTPNCGYLFVSVALAYFVNYEWFHLLYHLPPRSTLGRLALARRLREHHTRHHDPRLMSRYNFNITWPLCDWLFGTLK
ncbi:MAG: fatty acid hydroxylase family protein [Deltaproteobacteria bacterium]|nr:fatty acid hydroxylase family protein [Deltaproteobacteria bacterium]